MPTPPEASLALTVPPRLSRLRSDIQGLRAFAVGAVVADHAFGWPVGGFLGVDVFFVLSGFLITRLLLREVEQTGKISIRNFYARRARRILPLAVVTVLVVMLCSSLIFPRARLTSVAIDAAWAAGFGLNIRLGQIGTDYFASQGPMSPLQHFWSLSVEEQFYFVWPLGLFAVTAAVSRIGRRAVTVILSTVMTMAVIASFLVSLHLAATEPTVAYFATPSRVWQLGFGALLALGEPLLERIPGAVSHVLRWLGLFVLVAGIATIDSSNVLPAPWAALPVLGKGLVIVAGCGRHRWWCAPLTNPIALYLGTVSYSIYLWHFPALILGSAALGSSNPVQTTLILAAAFGVAICTHHLVEKPLMHSPWLTPRADPTRPRHPWRAWLGEVGPEVKHTGIATLAATTALITVLALIPARTPTSIPVSGSSSAAGKPSSAAPVEAGATPSGGEGAPAAAGPAVAALQGEIHAALEASAWPTDLEPSIDAVLDGTREGSPHLACGASDTNGRTQQQCSWGPRSAAKRVVLVGDSTAVHYLEGLIGVVEAEGSTWRLENRAMFACPFLDLEVQAGSADTIEKCKAHNQATLDYIASTKPDLVLVTNSYQDFKDNATNRRATQDAWTAALTTYVDRAAASGARLAALTSPPDSADIAACYTKTSTPNDCVTRTQSLWKTRATADRQTIEAKSGTFVDARPTLCLDDLCPAFVGTVPVKLDRFHLTATYSKKITPALRELLTTAGAL
ncbi:acyltransferase family protein [Frondihabitans cladoniiphilus]